MNQYLRSMTLTKQSAWQIFYYHTQGRLFVLLCPTLNQHQQYGHPCYIKGKSDHSTDTAKEENNVCKVNFCMCLLYFFLCVLARATLLTLKSNNHRIMQKNYLWAPIFKTLAISTALLKYFCFVLYCFWDTVLLCCADWLRAWDNPSAPASLVPGLKAYTTNKLPVSIFVRKLKSHQCTH